jgi:hypothetical protein
VHGTCPDAEEKKMVFPHFDYKGEMMYSMAAFKRHALFELWKAVIMNDRMLTQGAGHQNNGRRQKQELKIPFAIMLITT